MGSVIALAAVADAALVLLFVVIGRASHNEGEVLSGTLAVAAPFLIALAIGWLVVRAWRQPLSIRTGILVWLATWTIGMILRHTVFDRGTDVSFIIVAGLFTGLFIVGWRAVAGRLVTSRLVSTP